MTPDQREEYEERAAIMQYDGKLDRETAERLAMECVLKQGDIDAMQSWYGMR